MLIPEPLISASGFQEGNTMTAINAKSKKLKALSSQLKKSLGDEPVEVTNTKHLDGVAAGYKQGELIIKGDAGDYLGVLNAGATINLTGNAGKYVADNMTAGTIIVGKDAGLGAGMYCYGGNLVVRGDAGDFTGTMNKGATILVVGNIGDEAGTYMLAGNLIVVGNAGDNFANYLIRGNVFIGGDWETLGNNTDVVPLSEEDIEKLRSLLETYDVKAPVNEFKKIVAASEKPFYH
jgi:glutamate synthase domain-containing protein 3